MGNEMQLARPIGREITLSRWEFIKAVAPTMHQSRLFGVTSADQAAAIMLKGFELGLSLTASFEFIQVVQGKPGVSPRGALALVYQSGLLEKLEVKDDKDSCTVTMKRVGGPEYSLTWTMADAQNAGVVKDDSGWQKYPSNMLRWRCIGFVIDVLFPDVIGGMKRTDELGADLTQGGDTILPPDQPVQTIKAPDRAPVSLAYLLERYGAQRILDENGGSIPQTDGEVEAIAMRLDGGNGNG